MKYEEVDEYLINTFPDFIIDKIDEGLPYCVAGSFAHYLLEAYKDNSFITLILAGKFIEELYSYEDEKIDELATIGFFRSNPKCLGQQFNRSRGNDEVFRQYISKMVGKAESVLEW